jgi:L-ascorbate metabolism protein UlaG (beta-lactamase superfamily)
MSDLSRGAFFQVSAAAGAATSLASVPLEAAAAGNVPLKIRWYGGGVYELATPDDKTIVLVDAWIWNNTGFTAFKIPKPAELSSASAYATHIKSRNPDAVIVALTHDHGDHMGDYFELLGALTGAGIDVKTVGQSDLMRVALPPKFKAANLDNTKLVLNNGAGINMGGSAHYKGVRLELVPAVHSTAAGFPAAGFIIDIGGTRIYASGDTDLYGDLALVGRRYQPALAILSTGNGAFTMGPEDAALAVQILGVPQAIPVHFAHNPLVVGPQCGDLFRSAVARVAPSTRVTVLTPGQPTTLTLRAVNPLDRAAPPIA